MSREIFYEHDSICAGTEKWKRLYQIKNYVRSMSKDRRGGKVECMLSGENLFLQLRLWSGGGGEQQGFPWTGKTLNAQLKTELYEPGKSIVRCIF